MNKIIIGSNDEGKRLDSFLLSCFRSAPKALICKLIRKKKIKVNNKKVELNYRLIKNDIIFLYIKNEVFKSEDKNFDFFKTTSTLNVIYEDKNLLIINKPCGLLCHPDKNQKLDCLINRIKKYLFNKNEYNPEHENSFAPSLINRIDRNTQGLVIAAKNATSLKILNDKMKSKEIKKYYKSLCYGKLPKNEDTIIGFLSKNELTNTVKISKNRSKNSKLIKTKYKVEKYENGLSLLNVELLTGRTHQIRAHLAYIGNPIVGDKKYGKSFGNNKTKFQKLTSYKITFQFESDAGILNYLNGKVVEINCKF